MDLTRIPISFPLLAAACCILLHAVGSCVRHVEVACGVHREARRIADLAKGGALSGNKRPVPLYIPLLDPAIIGDIVSDIEGASSIHREGPGIKNLAESDSVRCQDGPVPQGIPLLDPGRAISIPYLHLCDIELAHGIHREG